MARDGTSSMETPGSTRPQGAAAGTDAVSFLSTDAGLLGDIPIQAQAQIQGTPAPVSGQTSFGLRPEGSTPLSHIPEGTVEASAAAVLAPAASATRHTTSTTPLWGGHPIWELAAGLSTQNSPFRILLCFPPSLSRSGNHLQHLRAREWTPRSQRVAVVALDLLANHWYVQ
jgi:hypothetical protein